MFRQRRVDEKMLTLHTEIITSYEKETTDLYPPTSSSYRPTKRRIKSGHLEDMNALVMNANVQTPVSGEKTYRYTGFNEPFSHDRNTTLAHPDADTSANATIEGPDFNLTRTHSRSSFFHSKNSHPGHSFRHPLNRSKYSVGAASICSDLSSLYDNIQYEDGTKEMKIGKEMDVEREERHDIVSAEKGVIPELLGGQKRKERAPNDSGVDMDLDPVERESAEEYRAERKKGFMGKSGL